jgi:glycosyltransferase involved in cell wall biosynthesis
MNRIAVMQMIDTLDIGGAERVAVNLANALPRGQYESYLCTTRREGPLSDALAPDVGRLCLLRRRRFDWPALRRLVGFIRTHQVRVLHAHGTALLTARLAALFPPHPAVIWHDHYGPNAAAERPVHIYRLLTRRVAGVLAVSRPLLQWSRERLGVPATRVWYLPNFVSEPSASAHNEATEALPGAPGTRIVCVANVRPEKDHATLLRAMALVVEQVPAAHLLLVGKVADAAYGRRMEQEIQQLRLSSHVSLLGLRSDVESILRACDIGVLSSCYEGLPLSLLEYGMAGLPVVATAVGQCAEVLEEGRVGILVPPSDPAALAEGLLALLHSPQERSQLGSNFRRHVHEVYTAAAAIERVCQVYEAVLQGAYDLAGTNRRHPTAIATHGGAGRLLQALDPGDRPWE